MTDTPTQAELLEALAAAIVRLRQCEGVPFVGMSKQLHDYADALESNQHAMAAGVEAKSIIDNMIKSSKVQGKDRWALSDKDIRQAVSEIIVVFALAAAQPVDTT